ncbi:MAG: hypothetical protein WC412_00725 [Candidatus Omnitrophota bacterium]|jgi:processive 1,2-diacylglycerol beta-glucosyltransferase
MDKILLVHASFGEGHKRAATALKSFLNAECVDLLDFSYPFVKKIYLSLYAMTTERMYFLWNFVFVSTENKFMRCFSERIQEFIFFHFFEYLRKTKPQVIVSTHFFPLSFVARIKKEFDVKLIVIVTDLRAHPIWAHKAVDAYFVPLEETKNDLIKAGIAADRITSGYVSLREGFLEQSNEAEIRKKFSFDERPVILFMSSLRGNFPFFDEIVNRIKDKFNIFVIYGKNKELKAYLENLKIDNLKFLPSCEEIWEIFQISSVLVTKPGGLTTFEGVYKRKTFIFLRYIPGQEEENMKILIKHNIGRFVHDTNGFFDALDYLTQRASTLKDDYPLRFTDIRKVLKETIARITKT